MRPLDVVRVAALARVEGDGGVTVRVVDGRVSDVEVRIWEPPRFFEALLRGRAAREAPDLTARVCGICPVAYQLSACAAVEQACGVTVSEPIRLLRRLLYCGEWISSHALHVYLLHAPDFLGVEGVADLAATHPDLLERGLRLKHAGNQLMEAVGGRSIHPVNVQVGGFHRWPERATVAALRPVLDQGMDDALATVRLVSGFTFGDLERPYTFVALRADRPEYPLESGSVVTSDGRAFAVDAYRRHVVEEQVPWSHALHARLEGGGPFVVGPLARFALNADRLAPAAAQAAREAGLTGPCRNPSRAIVVRAVELVQAAEDARRLLDLWTPDGPPAVDVPMRAGVGHGATEAPRGVLYHRYALDDDGTLLDADLVPPTAQNLASLEADVRAVAEAGLDLPPEELTRRCESVVRSYDPCISCATHIVTLSRS